MRTRRNPRPLLTVGDVLGTVIGEALAVGVIACVEWRGRFDDLMARFDEKHANAINGEEDQA